VLKLNVDIAKWQQTVDSLHVDDQYASQVKLPLSAYR
jgi:hypothetical protein